MIHRSYKCGGDWPLIRPEMHINIFFLTKRKVDTVGLKFQTDTILKVLYFRFNQNLHQIKPAKLCSGLVFHKNIAQIHEI